MKYSALYSKKHNECTKKSEKIVDFVTICLYNKLIDGCNFRMTLVFVFTGSDALTERILLTGFPIAIKGVGETGGRLLFTAYH